jgi:predicted Fe-Mo cluster-binding NifX family protein
MCPGAGQNMRIAIPIWDDKISPVLDTASRLLIVDVENRTETYRFEIHLVLQDLAHRCFRIYELEVDILICGAVSRAFLKLLKELDIEVIPEITGKIDDVLDAYFLGNLFHSRFLMPGCKRHRFRKRNLSPVIKASIGHTFKKPSPLKKH